jgi:uncharacterized protein
VSSVLRMTDSTPLWEGFEQGEVRLPFCTDCGLPHLPAGPVCPYCLSTPLEWRPVSGRATLSTWVVERKQYFPAFVPPYIVAEVQLAEGPRMPAQVPIEHLDRLRVDTEGHIEFALAGNGITLPVFVPDTGPTPD